jgi:hypothetical protein
MTHRRAILAVLMLSVVGGATRADDAEEAAVRVVLRLGGVVERNGLRPGNPVVRVDLGETRATDADLRHLVVFSRLERLSLNGTDVTDAGLRHLACLPQLSTLDLGNTRITDEGVRTVAKLRTLTGLLLNGTGVTDEGAKELARLKR